MDALVRDHDDVALGVQARRDRQNTSRIVDVTSSSTAIAISGADTGSTERQEHVARLAVQRGVICTMT